MNSNMIRYTIFLKENSFILFLEIVPNRSIKD